jgi:hypothetical protein
MIDMRDNGDISYFFISFDCCHQSFDREDAGFDSGYKKTVVLSNYGLNSNCNKKIR